jgi:hypothetical protein
MCGGSGGVTITGDFFPCPDCNGTGIAPIDPKWLEVYGIAPDSEQKPKTPQSEVSGSDKSTAEAAKANHTTPPDEFEQVVDNGLDMMWNAHLDFSTSSDFKPRTEAKYIKVKGNWLNHYKAAILAAHEKEVQRRLSNGE